MGGKSILVTGGAGYIGSHACKALSVAGYQPVSVDTLIYGHDSLVKWGPLERVDIHNEAAVAGIMKAYRIDAVMHFAGLINVADSVRNPDAYHHANVGGTLSLMNAMRAAGVSKLIFSSSCAVHGNPGKAVLSEDDPCAPLSPYGETKRLAEQAIAEYAAAYGMSAVILRYFNAAGADADGDTGEMHDPETHIIPLALRAAIRGREFSVYGTDYATPDGSAVRDYVHVSDLARGHLLALDYLSRASGVATFNLGTGSGISVLQIVGEIGRLTGRPLGIVHAPRREGDPPVLVADPRKAKEILGFVAENSSLSTILQTALAWHSREKV